MKDFKRRITLIYFFITLANSYSVQKMILKIRYRRSLILEIFLLIFPQLPEEHCIKER
jgi:hypothetical protein